MNVFVLSTGRCGSLTFVKACRHITNYTAAHQSRMVRNLGKARFAYPENHIESDNRLSWLLGRLDCLYGDAAFYVHLIREQEATARSYHLRWGLGHGIISAYARGILLTDRQSLEICSDYWETVNSNIRLFLKDKSRQMSFRLENAKEDFRVFWRMIGAEGNVMNALKEWDTAYNASVPERGMD